jgi:hypothetical protein
VTPIKLKVQMRANSEPLFGKNAVSLTGDETEAGDGLSLTKASLSKH